MEATILTIDCGTQSLRAILFSLSGDIVDKEQIFYEPYFSTQPGYAEQDAEVYWNNLCKATQAIKKRSPEKFNNIEGVGITTLRNTLVNLDKNGKPIRPIMTWLDQRMAKPFYKPIFPMNLIFKAIGVSRTLEKMQCEGKCNWIRQHEPDIWDNTYKYVQVSGFLHHRLTGKYIDSTASQIGFTPFSYKKQQWAKTGDLFEFSAKLFPIEKEKLPELVNPGEKIGKITASASQLTGIKQDIPVIAAGSDKGCETLGMGVINNTIASLSFGTTATIQTTVRKYMEPIPFFPSYPSIIPQMWNPEIEIYRGFWMITWFKNEFALKEVLEAKDKNIPAEVIMNKMLHKAPPGSKGLIVQPYWSPGLGEKNAKGAIIGFGDVHKKEHVYRAVIEGLAYGLKDGMQRLKKRGNFKFEKLAVSGGASQSDEICQITADIFNMPLVRGKTYETSGLGAAIITAFGINKFHSINAAVKNMVNYQTTFYPNKENVSLYDDLFHDVYLKMYKQLEPLYKKIRNITKYPQI